MAALKGRGSENTRSSRWTAAFPSISAPILCAMEPSAAAFLLGQRLQGIPVLGEDDHLLGPVRLEHPTQLAHQLLDLGISCREAIQKLPDGFERLHLRLPAPLVGGDGGAKYAPGDALGRRLSHRQGRLEVAQLRGLRRCFARLLLAQSGYSDSGRCAKGCFLLRLR
jgi:hypothetical protein